MTQFIVSPAQKTQVGKEGLSLDTGLVPATDTDSWHVIGLGVNLLALTGPL